MNACFHKLSILNGHDSEQIVRANLLRIPWKHATAACACVEAASECDWVGNSVSNVNGCVATAQPKNGPHRQPVVSYSAYFVYRYPSCFALILSINNAYTKQLHGKSMSTKRCSLSNSVINWSV